MLLCTPQAAPATAGEKLFATRVYPLLAAKCFACHGAKKKKEAELDLTTRKGMLRGGDTSDQVLVPGKPAKSLLWAATSGTDPDVRMPPKKSDWLSRQQVESIRKWIAAGAPWPAKSRREALFREYQQQQSRLVTVKTSGGLSKDWTERRYRPEQLWAYKPVQVTALPRTTAAWKAAHPVDSFVNARLQSKKIAPAARADRATLIRRVTYTLTGLPPTTNQITTFLNDPRPDELAFAELVDRLLASPMYGEHWGRHWLDVVRYADTSGMANDFERPNSWRYRDYVVRSFNADRPYNQFVLQQIAGDELPLVRSASERTENLIAAGFLRMGPWEQTGMSVARLTRQQFLDDVTDAVGQVFLSHPLQCCRCHDHKFDPIPTRDYYSIQAVFATTQFATRRATHLASENRSSFEQRRADLQQQMHRYQQQLDRIYRKRNAAEREWYRDRWLEYAPRRELMRKGVAANKIAPRHIGLTTTDFGLERISRKNLTRHRWEMDQFRPLAFSVYSGATRLLRNVNRKIDIPQNPLAGPIEKTRILKGGSPFARGAPVSPGVLSCIKHFNKNLRYNRRREDERPRGRRYAFALWVTHRDNPLTTRSIVNRVWQWHFGRGLVRDANNFGAMGGAPSHPQLLDWLTTEVQRRGWSLKALHRIILNSDTWCRASRHPQQQQVRQKDPNNRLYAFFEPRRLTAEELRDSMLMASGELNVEQGGLPIRPEIELEVALQPRQIMGTYAPAYQPSRLPAQRHRRSIYVMQIRGLRDPFLEVFNQPGSTKSCSRRESSTITPQVFAMWNGQFSHDRALAMATNVLSRTRSSQQAIEAAFRQAFGRQPTQVEARQVAAHWRRMKEFQSKVQPKRQHYPRQIIRNAIEEMNGEPFTFVEKLDYDRFVPDLKPWQVDASTRAFADVCHVLLNTNEFMFVR